MAITAADQRLSQRVAEEVRAWMGRRRMSGVGLAVRIDRTQAYVSRRLTGEVAFDIDDLERIAVALDVEISDLLPQRVPTRQYLSRPTDRPQAATHRPPNKPGSRRPQRRNVDRLTAGMAA